MLLADRDVDGRSRAGELDHARVGDAFALDRDQRAARRIRRLDQEVRGLAHLVRGLVGDDLDLVGIVLLPGGKSAAYGVEAGGRQREAAGGIAALGAQIVEARLGQRELAVLVALDLALGGLLLDRLGQGFEDAAHAALAHGVPRAQKSGHLYLRVDAIAVRRSRNHRQRECLARLDEQARRAEPDVKRGRMHQYARAAGDALP